MNKSATWALAGPQSASDKATTVLCSQGISNISLGKLRSLDKTLFTISLLQAGLRLPFETGHSKDTQLLGSSGAWSQHYKEQNGR